ncbi:MAG: hypothetical protein IPL06_17505 [Betaproteobacteria bacterium]|nr:hypothetical protein [Betaproteobacteria bacterium]
MKRLPAASKARPEGLQTAAVVAGTSLTSVVVLQVPLPAMVLIVPAGVTRRTRWLLASAMYRSPEGPMASARGKFSRTDVAAPSPV